MSASAAVIVLVIGFVLAIVMLLAGGWFAAKAATQEGFRVGVSFVLGVVLIAAGLTLLLSVFAVVLSGAAALLFSAVAH